MHTLPIAAADECLPSHPTDGNTATITAKVGLECPESAAVWGKGRLADNLAITL